MTSDVALPDWVSEYYELVDANELAACGQRFAEDIELQFGSRPLARGKAEAARTLGAAHEPWTAVSHHIRHLWEEGDTTLIEFAATYDLTAGFTKTIPTFTVLQRRDGLIANMRVYIDEGSLTDESP